MTVALADSTPDGARTAAEPLEAFAPGWPGAPARWTSSAKTAIGTALSRDSRVWFTLSHGILNEIYYPRVDHACTRDLGFIVTDGDRYFSDEKRNARSDTAPVAPGIPAYRVQNTAADGRFRIEKEILTDPWRDVVLQRVRFVPVQGTLSDFRLFVRLAPHLANRGAGNTAWVGDDKGVPMLFAERAHHALALGSSAPWLARSAGFVGASDGWQELRTHGYLPRTYRRAENGNVALTGEIDLASCQGTFVLALGFGPAAMEAAQHARISLPEDFGRAWPLLTGERAHYELAAGRMDVARQLAAALETIAGPAGLLPEQIWDSADIADHELFLGQPSGSAMPLVWAHAEYIKLCRSLFDGEIFDRPRQTVDRYLVGQRTSNRTIWRFNSQERTMPANGTLRIETLAPVVVHWSGDDWRTVHDTPSGDTTLGVHVADLAPEHLVEGDRVRFTLYWPDAGRWEGENFLVCVGSPPGGAAP